MAIPLDVLAIDSSYLALIPSFSGQLYGILAYIYVKGDGRPSGILHTSRAASVTSIDQSVPLSVRKVPDPASVRYSADAVSLRWIPVNQGVERER